MTAMTSQDARSFWKALMDNASALIADAHVLLDAGSFGRARALTVLAQEELGKALWIYEAFSEAWNTGATAPRAVDRLAKHGRDHVRKFLEAIVYGDELALFWGDYSLPLPHHRAIETHLRQLKRIGVRVGMNREPLSRHSDRSHARMLDRNLESVQ